MEEIYRYVGSFRISNEEMSGELIHDKTNGVILLDLKREYSELGKGEESFDFLDVITGRLNSGSVVSLFNNKCITNLTRIPAYQQLQFASSHLIWAGETVVEPRFNALNFTLKNALAWSNLSWFDDTDLRDLHIVDEPDKREFKWFGAKITFAPILNNWCRFPRDEETNIIQRLKVVIETDEKNDLDYFIIVRDRIIALISFAIKDNVNIEEQFCIDNDKYQCLVGHKSMVKHHLILAEPVRAINKTSIYKYNFKLTQLNNGKDVDKAIEKLSPVFNLYLSLFRYRDMPIEMVFLNVVQAVETFHSRFFYNNDKDEYVTSVIGKYGDKPNYDKIKQLLLSGNQESEKCNSIYLVSRINDLLLNSNVRQFSYYCAGDNKRFARQIVDTRNYYTHYDKAKEKKALKGKELEESIIILRLLLEYNICLSLGIDNKEMVQDELVTYRTRKNIRKYQSARIRNCSHE